MTSATGKDDRRGGWQRPAAALLLGGLAACGFAPLGLWPLALLGMARLIALVASARTARGAGWLGWCWGVGHFSIGNNWIATAFTYQAKMPTWLGGIAVVALALYLAVWPALAAAVAARLGRRPVALVLAMAGAWTLCEWLRGWVFTGFPWNPLGAVALGPFARPGLAGLAPWLGTYALSGLVVLLAGCWWLAWDRQRRGLARIALVAVPAGLMLAPLPVAVDRPGTVRFTLVQPNIDQTEIDKPALFEGQFWKTARLSTPRDGGPRLVLWPESGVPDYLRDRYPAEFYRWSTFAGDPFFARARIARAIGPASLLLTGAVDLDIRGGEVAGARNVVTGLDGRGSIVASYAKAHLVPYGEYLPMRGLLEPLGLARLVPGAIDFIPGPGPRTLDLGRFGKAGMQICYEIVFSGEVVDRAHRPDFLFNPSNDGWFGSWGPPQHLAQARLRAIEEGLPVLRATTNGISAVIDASGVVRAAIPRHRGDRIDMAIPPAHSPSLFARFGNALVLFWSTILLTLALAADRLRSRRLPTDADLRKTGT